MRKAMIMGAALLLAACGGGREGKALDACERALAEKAGGKEFSFNKAELRASAKAEGADQIMISGEITFDPGLPREAKQRMECTARFSEGSSEPDIISFALIWQ